MFTEEIRSKLDAIGILLHVAEKDMRTHKDKGRTVVSKDSLPPQRKTIRRNWGATMPQPQLGCVPASFFRYSLPFTLACPDLPQSVHVQAWNAPYTYLLRKLERRRTISDLTGRSNYIRS